MKKSSDTLKSSSSIRSGLTWPLIDLVLIRADVANARAAFKEQDAKLSEATRVAKLEVEKSLYAVDQARKEVESFEAGRIARAKELCRENQRRVVLVGSHSECNEKSQPTNGIP